MSKTLIDELNSLRSRLNRELYRVYDRASSFFTASLLGFILSIILGISLVVSITSIIRIYVETHRFIPEYPPPPLVEQVAAVTAIFAALIMLVELYILYNLSRFMDASIKGFQILHTIDEKLRNAGSSKLFVLGIEYIYPPSVLVSYPKNILVIAVLSTPLAPLVAYNLMLGLLLGNRMNLLIIGIILASFMVILNIYVIYMVYRFFKALGKYYNAEKAESLATLFIIINILNFIGLIPKISDTAKLVGFILTIPYLIYLYKLVDDLRESCDKIITKLNNIVEELKEEAIEEQSI